MDKYLTSYIDGLHNYNGKMRGGVLNASLNTELSTLNNSGILDKYFSTRPSIKSGNSGVFRNEALKAEFLQNQVDIVELMLRDTQTQKGGGIFGGMFGGMFGGDQKAEIELAADAASHLENLGAGGVPVGVPGGVPGGILDKFKKNTKITKDDLTTANNNINAVSFRNELQNDINRWKLILKLISISNLSSTEDTIRWKIILKCISITF